MILHENVWEKKRNERGRKYESELKTAVGKIGTATSEYLNAAENIIITVRLHIGLYIRNLRTTGCFLGHLNVGHFESKIHKMAQQICYHYI